LPESVRAFWPYAALHHFGHNFSFSLSLFTWISVSNRSLAVSIAALFVAVACGPSSSRLAIDVPSRQVVADGESRVAVLVHAEDGLALKASELDATIAEHDGRGRIARLLPQRQPGQVAIELVPGVNPGTLTLDVRGPALRPAHVTLHTVLAPGDYFQDGTPDFLRLATPEDRSAFRSWFTLLAERQALAGVTLPPEISDCAGLLRYAYREAMRRHDSTWAVSSNLGALPAVANIEKYSYPYTPLGAHIFRVREGRFTPADLSDGAFAEFADAKTLIAENTHFLSRDLRLAQPGDLIFYRQFEQRSPFHSMIFVYHTGPEGKWPGEIRRVTLSSLLAHPDARWRPQIANPNFLGVYRWNILREAK
jgi:hypothetical protein